MTDSDPALDAFVDQPRERFVDQPRADSLRRGPAEPSRDARTASPAQPGAEDQRSAQRPAGTGQQGAARRGDPFSEDNLQLGANSIYAADIRQAAARTGLPPQTIAAIINAEAAVGRGGVWDPNSSAGTASTARGLTQFVSDSWLLAGNRRGSYLNDVASRQGWLDRDGHILPARRQAFLNLRFNARHSILAAAENAQRNLAELKVAGLILDTSQGALARYAYIAHHEGLAGARAFLRGTLVPNDQAWNGNLHAQATQQLWLARYGNNRNMAYRAFLADYIDDRVDVRHFMANPQGVEVPPTRCLYR